MTPMKTFAFAALIALSFPLVLAQEARSSDDPNMQANAQRVEREDNMDFGWIGLLGLAGLMGLKRKERDVGVRTPNRAP